eukprot:11893309-Alexandrium_andersonii.AAC.1
MHTQKESKHECATRPTSWRQPCVKRHITAQPRQRAHDANNKRNRSMNVQHDPHRGDSHASKDTSAVHARGDAAAQPPPN